MVKKKDSERPRRGPTADALRAKILDLIGQGKDRRTICSELDMHKSTYFNYLKDIQEEMNDKGVIAEKRAKILKASEDIFRMALADYAAMRKFTSLPDGTTDPRTYSGMDKQIRTLTQAKESLEKTYARFGAIPQEKQILMHEGEAGPSVKLFAIDASKYQEAFKPATKAKKDGKDLP